MKTRGNTVVAAVAAAILGFAVYTGVYVADHARHSSTGEFLRQAETTNWGPQAGTDPDVPPGPDASTQEIMRYYCQGPERIQEFQERYPTLALLCR